MEILEVIDKRIDKIQAWNKLQDATSSELKSEINKISVSLKETEGNINLQKEMLSNLEKSINVMCDNHKESFINFQTSVDAKNKKQDKKILWIIVVGIATALVLCSAVGISVINILELIL